MESEAGSFEFAEEYSQPSPESAPPPITPADPTQGNAWIAWGVILIIVALRMGMEFSPQKKPAPAEVAKGIPFVVELQAKFLVGLHEVGGELNKAEPLQKLYQSSIEQMNLGSFEQRICSIITLAELRTPQTALDALTALETLIQTHDAQNPVKPVWNAERKQLTEIVRRSLLQTTSDRDPALELQISEQRLVREKLNWFGELLLTPPSTKQPQHRQEILSSAERLAVVSSLILAVLTFWLILGLVTWFFGLILISSDNAEMHFEPSAGTGGVYAEAFAVWLVAYAVFGSLAALWRVPGWELLQQGLGMLVCLVFAMIWTIMRGVPWSLLRTDIGLTTGRSILVEPLLGFIGYWLTLPLLGAGLVITTVLLTSLHLGQAPPDPNSFEPQALPSHPIVTFASEGNLAVLLQIMWLACVMAPLVEETMFRGFLYRHLRNCTGRWGRFLSCTFSVLWNSFVFAAIHPQGWIAIPPLMGIACGLSLIREWRDSLLPCMVTHGLSNGVVMLILAAATL